jgi:hypothetical protein
MGLGVGKQGHLQRNCRERNSSGAVAVIAPKEEEPPASQLGQEVVEVKMNTEETALVVRQCTSETVNAVTEGKKPVHLRGERRQKKKKKQMEGGGEPPRKPPLWVKLNFKVGEVPSLVDTGAQFSCIRRDVMQTLSELGVKTKKSSCRLMCHLANGLRCVIRETVQLHFLIGKFSWNFQLFKKD